MSLFQFLHQWLISIKTISFIFLFIVYLFLTFSSFNFLLSSTKMWNVCQTVLNKLWIKKVMKLETCLEWNNLANYVKLYHGDIWYKIVTPNRTPWMINDKEIDLEASDRRRQEKNYVFCMTFFLFSCVLSCLFCVTWSNKFGPS